MSPTVISVLLEELIFCGIQFIYFTKSLQLQKCGDLGGDPYLCEDVAMQSYQRDENETFWADLVRRQGAKFTDRAHNDPEETRVYSMYTLCTATDPDGKKTDITNIFGNCEEEKFGECQLLWENVSTNVFQYEFCGRSQAIWDDLLTTNLLQ